MNFKIPFISCILYKTDCSHCGQRICENFKYFEIEFAFALCVYKKIPIFKIIADSFIFHNTK